MLQGKVRPLVVGRDTVPCCESALLRSGTHQAVKSNEYVKKKKKGGHNFEFSNWNVKKCLYDIKGYLIIFSNSKIALSIVMQKAGPGDYRNH